MPGSIGRAIESEIMEISTAVNGLVCLAPIVIYFCYPVIKFDGSCRRYITSDRKSLSVEVSIFRRSSIVSCTLPFLSDLAGNVINRNDLFSCNGEYTRTRSSMPEVAYALEIKKGQRRRTTIGILRKTLNINRESEGALRRFIRVFVHGGESFAVCQRF